MDDIRDPVPKGPPAMIIVSRACNGWTVRDNELLDQNVPGYIAARPAAVAGIVYDLLIGMTPSRRTSLPPFPVGDGLWAEIEAARIRLYRTPYDFLVKCPPATASDWLAVSGDNLNAFAPDTDAIVARQLLTTAAAAMINALAALHDEIENQTAANLEKACRD